MLGIPSWFLALYRSCHNVESICCSGGSDKQLITPLHEVTSALLRSLPNSNRQLLDAPSPRRGIKRSHLNYESCGTHPCSEQHRDQLRFDKCSRTLTSAAQLNGEKSRHNWKTMARTIIILLAALACFSLVVSSTETCYPDLLDVDAEELVAGLESGAWTSVDLTKVNCLTDFI